MSDPKPRQFVEQAGALVTTASAALIRTRGTRGLPKGHVEDDEAPIDAAIRETYEETGVHIRCTAFLGRITYENRGRRIRLHLYLAEPAEDHSEHLPPGPSRDADWMPLLAAFRVLEFPEYRTALRAALAMRAAVRQPTRGSPLETMWPVIQQMFRGCTVSAGIPDRVAISGDRRKIVLAFGSEPKANKVASLMNLLNHESTGDFPMILDVKGPLIVLRPGSQAKPTFGDRVGWERIGGLLGLTSQFGLPSTPRNSVLLPALSQRGAFTKALGLLSPREAETLSMMMPDWGVPLGPALRVLADPDCGLVIFPTGELEPIPLMLAAILNSEVPDERHKQVLRGYAQRGPLAGLRDDLKRWLAADVVTQAARATRVGHADLSRIRADLHAYAGPQSERHHRKDKTPLVGHSVSTERKSEYRVEARGWISDYATVAGSKYPIGEVWQGDNQHALEAMARGARRFALAYLDPPFGSNADYFINRPDGEHRDLAFSDRWPGGLETYLEHMSHRLNLTADLLTPNGWLILHTIPDTGSYVRVLADGILGRSRFRGEVIWSYLWTSRHRGWLRCHDVLLCYAMGPKPYGSPLRKGDVLSIPVVPESERIGLDTQKPLELLRKLIARFAVPGMPILDPYLGSGTTAIAASLSGHEWVGVENSRPSLLAIRKRLAEAHIGAEFRLPVMPGNRRNAPQTQASIRIDPQIQQRRIRYRLVDPDGGVEYWAVGPRKPGGKFQERWRSFQSRLKNIDHRTDWYRTEDAMTWSAVAFDSQGNELRMD